MRQPDASKLQDGHGMAKGQIPVPRQKKAACQIHHIVGDCGRYQIMIFIFKILIGVVSPFNNLGVTFFAPRDFIGHWCADQPATNGNLSTILHNGFHQNVSYNLAQNHTHHHGANLHYHAVSALNQQPASNIMAGQALTRAHRVDHMEVLSSFLSGQERKARHAMNLDYDTPRNLIKECSITIENHTYECKSHKFNKGIWISTIIDEWDLVCDKSWYISLSQSLYMSGFIVAYLVFGQFSDTYGRWRSLLLGALIEIVCGFGCAFADSISMFLAFRFLLGIGNAGRTASSYLIMIEWFGPKWRVHMSVLGSLGWTAGYCAMPWLSLYFLHFRHLQLFGCFYELLFLAWLLTLPESPRWLMTHNKYDKAYQVLLTAAKYNGLIRKEDECSNKSGYDNNSKWIAVANNNKNGYPKCAKMVGCDGLDEMTAKSNGIGLNGSAKITNGAIQGNLSMCPITLLQDNTLKKVDNTSVNLFELQANAAKDPDDPNYVLEPYTLMEFNHKFKRLVDTFNEKEFTEKEDKPSLLDLFRWKNLSRWAIILFFLWGMNSFIYYGIALRVGTFGSKNLFNSFTMAGISEVPGLVLSICFLNYLPRKTSNMFFLSAVGVLCAIQVPLRYYGFGSLQLVTIMIAKIFNSSGFTLILYQTMEIFPTSIRQTSYSACSLSGRIGSILSPFINELSNATNELVPPMIYACLSLIGFMMTGSLPETKGADLPDTLLEAENFKAKTKSKSKESGNP